MFEKERMIICVKDIQIITGKSERSARYLLKKIKEKLNKKKEHMVTFKEFYEEIGVVKIQKCNELIIA